MRKFRINNDVPVIWRIVDKQTLMPFDLEGKTVKVALQNRFGIVPIEEFDVSGNVISFIFKAAQQGWLGVYTATVSIVDSDGQTWTVDDCQMLELVARSCCVDVCDCQGVNATSCVEFALSIVVDQDLEEGSRNPVAGGAVAEAINGLGDELSRMAAEQGDKNETFEQGIENNKRRVFKYHIDPESDTPALIETGDDWLHNSAVLDWLFRNGADGVDRAEAKVPCVVIIPVGGSGFAQNVYDWIVATWGEEDGLVFFNVIFSSQFAETSSLINAYYSRAEGSTTWNKNQLEFDDYALQTVEDNPVERGAGAHSLQQKAEPNNENSASGLCSTAFGHSNEATEHCSYVEGYDNHSGGWASHVEGVENVAGPNAHFAHVGGTRCEASSECAFVHGRGLQATDEQAVFGSYNASAGGQALVVGGGSSNADRRNAFTVPKNPGSAARVWNEKIVNETKSLSYADLVSLRNSANLIPGRFYRITDYGTTTTQFATRSYGRWFDVIVLALERNVLSENAWAIHSARDTDGYFANSDLSAWRLKYCLDNDTDRFTWADSEHGTGVIYQMEDEFGNIAPYDFKNIETYWGYVIEVELYGTRFLCLQSPDNPKQYRSIMNSPLGDEVLEFANDHPYVGNSATNKPNAIVLYELNIPENGWKGISDNVHITGSHFSGARQALPYIGSDVPVSCEVSTSTLVCYVVAAAPSPFYKVELDRSSAVLMYEPTNSTAYIHVYNSARVAGLNFPYVYDERHVVITYEISGVRIADIAAMNATIFESVNIDYDEEDLMFVKNGKKVTYSDVAELVG